MLPVRHPERAPDIERLLDTLRTHEIRYVLIGSVATRLYGVEVQPGDLDITPAFDDENLRRLITVLVEIEATIDGGAGHWDIQPDGERKWVEVALTVTERAARAAAWLPQLDDITTLDHVFRTRYGNFDVVPELLGTYDTLIQRAVRMEVEGQAVWVAHVDDLLATLTVPRRQKDVPRVQALRAIQRERGV